MEHDPLFWMILAILVIFLLIDLINRGYFEFRCNTLSNIALQEAAWIQEVDERLKKLEDKNE